MVARNVPEPAETKLPDITVSPTALWTGSDSPVNSDSSISNPALLTTSPSTTTCAPEVSTSRSSATTSSMACSEVTPSRMTVACGVLRTARRSSAVRARSS